jgi:hypothetical protein
MSEVVTLEQVEAMATQLPPREQLKLISDLSAGLTALPIPAAADEEWKARLALAERLLAECDDIEDDSQGEFDAVEDVRRSHEEREARICQNDA